MPAAAILLFCLAALSLNGCASITPATVQSNTAAIAADVLAADASLKPDLQTALTVLQNIQVGNSIVTPAGVVAALNKGLAAVGVSATHQASIANALTPLLTNVSTDLPAVIAGLNSVLNPPAAPGTPASPPAH